MPTNTGSRIILIARTRNTAPRGGRREAIERQQATPRRIVLIKDGQFVGVRPAAR